MFFFYDIIYPTGRDITMAVNAVSEPSGHLSIIAGARRIRYTIKHVQSILSARVE